MKLKITEAGFETYTGNMSGISFTNGVSDTDETPERASGLAATMRVDWIDSTNFTDDGADDVTDPTVNDLTDPSFGDQ